MGDEDAMEQLRHLDDKERSDLHNLACRKFADEGYEPVDDGDDVVWLKVS